MKDYIGKHFGDYKIIEEIGSGGMGKVFLAENVHHHKKYALKVLPDELSKEADFRKRFFDEARVMSELDHPRIVRVHHMGEHEGVYYLVMDYVTGPEGKPWSLHNELKERPDKRIPEEQAKEWLIQIADGLAYAHRRGVIHRDIKPSNVLITTDGSVKITDFGLAKAVGSEFILSQIHQSMKETLSSHQLQRADKRKDMVDTLDVAATIQGKGSSSSRSSTAMSLLGTYDYMAPEQRGEGGEVNQTTDIYAMGLLIYRLLTGRRIKGLAKPPSTVVQGLSTDWDEIVSTCLVDEQSQRYASGTALLEALQGLCIGKAVLQPQKHVQVPTRWCLVRTLVMVVMLVLMGLAIVSGLFAYKHYRASYDAEAKELFMQAIALEQNDKYDEAIASYNTVNTKFNRSEFAAQALAGVVRLQEEKARVSELLNHARQKGENAHNLITAGNFPEAIKEFDLALETLQHLFQLRPDNETVSALQKKFDEGKKKAEEEKTKDDRYSDLYQMAEQAVSDEKWNSAILALQQALRYRSEPEAIELLTEAEYRKYFQSGMLLVKVGEAEKAIEAFKLALQKKPGAKEANEEIAKAMAHLELLKERAELLAPIRLRKPNETDGLSSADKKALDSLDYVCRELLPHIGLVSYRFSPSTPEFLRRVQELTGWKPKEFDALFVGILYKSGKFYFPKPEVILKSDGKVSAEGISGAKTLTITEETTKKKFYVTLDDDKGVLTLSNGSGGEGITGTMVENIRRHEAKPKPAQLREESSWFYISYFGKRMFSNLEKIVIEDSLTGRLLLEKDLPKVKNTGFFLDEYIKEFKEKVEVDPGDYELQVTHYNIRGYNEIRTDSKSISVNISQGKTKTLRIVKKEKMDWHGPGDSISLEIR